MNVNNHLSRMVLLNTILYIVLIKYKTNTSFQIIEVIKHAKS